MNRRLPALVAIASSLIIGLIILGAAPKQNIPPFPIIYLGDVSVQNRPAPEGISLVACVGGCASWESEPVLTLANSRYVALTVRAPEALLRQEITFWIVEPESGERIQAQQTDSYDPDLNVARTLDLAFDYPIPTPPPTDTPTPRPPDGPPPTATVIPPVPGDPAVQTLSRVAVFVGVGALLVGGATLYLIRRRRAF